MSSFDPERFITVGRYLIDHAQMKQYEFACEPTECVEKGEYCCNRFELDVSRTEMERMTGMAAEAARYIPTLLDEEGDLENVFDEEGKRFVVEKREDDGDCPFSHEPTPKEKRCALHTAALDSGIDPNRVKPLPCRIWPLTLSQRDDNKVVVELDLESRPTCLMKKRGDRGTVSPGLRGLLEGLLGNRAAEGIDEIEAAGAK